MNIPNKRKSIYAEMGFLFNEKDTEVYDFDKTYGKLLFKSISIIVWQLNLILLAQLLLVLVFQADGPQKNYVRRG